MSACGVCDLPIQKGEPRKTLSDMAVHNYCDTGSSARVCRNSDCEYWMTDHAGPCSR